MYLTLHGEIFTPGALEFVLICCGSGQRSGKADDWINRHAQKQIKICFNIGFII